MSDEPIRNIALTEHEVLLANLEALGLRKSVAVRPTVVNVLDQFLAFIREHRKVPSALDIATELGVSPSTVRDACRKLVREGKMIRFENASNGHPSFIPKVV